MVDMSIGDYVMADVSLVRSPLAAVVEQVEGYAGIGWCVVKLTPLRDKTHYPADYMHMPCNRCQAL